MPWSAYLRRLLPLALSCLVACQRAAPPAATTTAPAASEERVVNVYNWYDYIEPGLLKQFEARTGIRVRYDVFDSNNTLEAKLLAGHSGYDVVFPSGAFLNSLLPAGVFRALDRSRLPHWSNLDPDILARLAVADPGNAHAVPYTWGITGIAWDEAKVRARLGAPPPDSWALLFDPQLTRRLADCGVGLYDSPNVIVPSVLAWLGRMPDSESPGDLQAVEQALLAARPNLRGVSTASLVDQLTSGELCVIIASNGDAMQARERARIAARGQQVGYSIPREGAVMWFDVAAIPADAPHPDNAHAFIDFLMEAEVAAANSNAIHFPNGNRAAQALIAPELANARIFPTGDLAVRLIPERSRSEAYVRERTRVWTRFRTGR